MTRADKATRIVFMKSPYWFDAGFLTENAGWKQSFVR